MKFSFGLRLSLAFLSIFLNHGIFSQNMSGIIGSRHIVGYRADYKFVQGELSTLKEKSSRYMHNFYFERMMNRRINLGMAVVRGNITADLKETSNNRPLYLRTNIEDRYLYILDYYGTCHMKHTGMEFYVKIFPGFGSLRNYGWYWKGGIGVMYTNFSFDKDVIVEAAEDRNYNKKKYYITNDNLYRIKKSYLAFEIGKNIPMIADRLIFTYSISNNIFFQKSNQNKMDMTMREFVDMTVGSHLAYRHSFTLNLGLAYAL